ncbi:MAG: glycogen phosphorylase, partial [Cyanobacteria bacterium RYN_339]|nr:glycogen phosphorylase [Cyanobacteria bacterium RYN_339]
EPTAARADALGAAKSERARDLAAWKRRVRDGWRSVHVDGVETNAVAAELGEPREVVAQVSIGDLAPSEVTVQLLHGLVGQNDELVHPEVVAMAVAGDAVDGHLRYKGTFTCERPGRYGFTVRVVPAHPDLVTPVELGCVAWA